MDVLLTYGGQAATLTLSPDILDLDTWAISKKYCGNRAYKDTGLAGPFTHVFLKRWIGQEAPAHSLLKQICGIELPGTPLLFGFGQEGKDWIYVFEHLPDTYWQLHELLDSPNGDKWLTAKILLAIIQQSVQTFAALESYEYVFTDYSAKNLMVDPLSCRFMFIDLDSAWPQPLLVEKKGQPNPTQFDIHFWRLWRDHMRERLWASRRVTEFLPRSMVLSFTAVWGLGLLAHPQLPEAQMLLQRRSEVNEWDFATIQKALWQALSSGNEERFREFFLLPSSPALQRRQGTLFDEWLRVFSDLVNGDYVPWPQIQLVAQALAREFLPKKGVEKPESRFSVNVDWFWNFLGPLAGKISVAFAQDSTAPAGPGDAVSAAGKMVAAVRDALAASSLPSVSPPQVARLFFAHLLVLTAGFIAAILFQALIGGRFWGGLSLLPAIAALGFYRGRVLRRRSDPPSRAEFALAAVGFTLAGVLGIAGVFLLFCTLTSGALILGFLELPSPRAFLQRTLRPARGWRRLADRVRAVPVPIVVTGAAVAILFGLLYLALPLPAPLPPAPNTAPPSAGNDIPPPQSNALPPELRAFTLYELATYCSHDELNLFCEEYAERLVFAVVHHDRLICAPSLSTQRIQVMLDFLKWAKTHPSLYTAPVTDGLAQFLRERFPCSTASPPEFRELTLGELVERCTTSDTTFAECLNFAQAVESAELRRDGHAFCLPQQPEIRKQLLRQFAEHERYIRVPPLFPAKDALVQYLHAHFPCPNSGRRGG